MDLGKFSSSQIERLMLTLVLFAVVLVPRTANAQTAVEWAQSAYEHEQSGELESAIRDYTRAIQIDPDYALAYNNRGNVYKDRGELETAIRDYTRAIQIDPDYAFPYNGRGNAYQDRGELEAAIRDYTRAIQIDPDYASPYNGRGNVYKDRGELETAIRDYTRAIQIDPDFSPAYNNRGNAYRDRGELEAAIRDYTRAIQIDPDYAFPYNGRGNVYKDRGELETAIRDYTRAIQIDPDFSPAYNGRGNAYKDRGELEAAIRDYTRAIQIAPQLHYAYGNRGIARGMRATYEPDYHEAIEDLETAVRLNPNSEYYQSELENVRIAFATRASRPDTPDEPALGTPASLRIALVIGNGQYRLAGDKLHNAEDDARDVVQALRNRGYEIYGGGPQLNLNVKQFDDVIEGFRQASIGAAASVVWYAGHGQQFADEEDRMSNWLIPVDAQISSPSDLRRQSVKLQRLINTVLGASDLRLVIVDACRNSSFRTSSKRSSSQSRGFGRVQKSDVVIVFSTEPGTPADDGNQAAQNSPFAQAFLEKLQSYNDEYITRFFAKVAGRTAELTGQEQIPEVIFKDRTGDHLAL